MCDRCAVRTIEQVMDWRHLWDAITAAVALAALALSWQNSRRISKADQRVQWELVDPKSNQSFHLRNLGPADAHHVQVDFPEGMEPLSRGPLDHEVVHSGSDVWVGAFAPQSAYTTRTRVRVMWKGGPKQGWSSQI